MPDDVLALAHRFITAAGDGDLEAAAACYAPGAVVFVNALRRESDVDGALAILADLHRRAASVRYEVLEVLPTSQGYVQRHVLHVGVPARDGHDAEELAVPACLVARVDADGRISRLDEYIDSGQVAPLFAR